jgi:uncharacterized YccA/Bax inhibitor family protein
VRSSNPVLTRSNRGFAQMDASRLENDSLEATYASPAASSLRTGRVTMDDVVMRTATLFAVLVAVGAFAWGANNPGLALVGFLGGFVLAMVNIFSKKVRVPLIVAYAAAQGLALGTVSRIYNEAYSGIVGQAVIGTLCAFGGILLAYRSGKIRVTPKFTRILIGSLIGYVVFSLITVFTGRPGGSLGLLIAVGAVALATFFLVLDFDQIERTIAAGAPQQESWRMAFGLMVTIVWLYMEVLRLLSILRNNE